MKYGPDLPQDSRLISRVGRGLQVIGLGAVATFLFTVALSLYLVMPLVNLSPVELYHNAWEQAKAHSYDPNAFPDWGQWEHKFDKDIKTQDDAVARVNELLKATGDHYAVFLDPKQTRQERDEMQGQFAGIGVKVAPKLDNDGKPVFGPDKDKGPLMADNADGFPTVEVMPGGPAAQSGIVDGDTVIAIEDRKSVV